METNSFDLNNIYNFDEEAPPRSKKGVTPDYHAGRDCKAAHDAIDVLKDLKPSKSLD